MQYWEKSNIFKINYICITYFARVFYRSNVNKVQLFFFFSKNYVNVHIIKNYNDFFLYLFFFFLLIKILKVERRMTLYRDIYDI